MFHCKINCLALMSLGMRLTFHLFEFPGFSPHSDYVLAYEKLSVDDPNRTKNEERRNVYEKNLKRAGLELEYEDNTVSVST